MSDEWMDQFKNFMEQLAYSQTTSNGYVDRETLDARCEDCIEGDYYRMDLSGGEDGQRWCEQCGVILDHPLTNWGIVEELSAIASIKDEPLSAGEALTVYNSMCCGLPDEVSPEIIKAIAKRSGFKFKKEVANT